MAVPTLAVCRESKAPTFNSLTPAALLGSNPLVPIPFSGPYFLLSMPDLVMAPLCGFPANFGRGVDRTLYESGAGAQILLRHPRRCWPTTATAVSSLRKTSPAGDASGAIAPL